MRVPIGSRVSDHELGKKIIEEEELNLFLEAYAGATDECLTLEARGERPDFLCRRPSGQRVGIELTRAMRAPDVAQGVLILSNDPFADAGSTLDRIVGAIEHKDSKRSTGDWSCRDRTILVLQVDCPLSELAPRLEDYGPEEFAEDHGFEEIWVSDQAELDAYGAVEVFCLYPEDLWGYYERDRGKPYG
jgi:hypothetical protein